MYLLGKIKVTPKLPEKLNRLKDLAYNLWWTWNSEALDLFTEIDPELMKSVNNNPVRLLREIDQKQLEQKTKDKFFMDLYEKVVNKFDSYMNDSNTWFNRFYPDKKNHMVAYFSAEYGLTEILPIYSGGLGVLSGDHCKTASDMGIPFTAIGLFYKEGYFEQRINKDGWQETEYPHLNTSHLPILPVLNNEGSPVLISVELPGRITYARIWQVKIGRVSLYLMDTDVEQNSDYDRTLTYRLYGGDQETRIQQEIFLGIGGIRVLEALGIKATVYHMNEGHSAFMGLELIRKLIEKHNMTFAQAKEAVSGTCVFTTHTPVPAGNDVFPFHMIDKYFSNYWNLLKISRHEFLDLGLKVGDQHNFNMTVLAFKLSGYKNGVSELHGAVSRKIFNNVWQGIPEDEVPITHITNGVHIPTWLAPSFKNIYEEYLKAGNDICLWDEEIFKKIDEIPDDVIWNTHYDLKLKMIKYLRVKLTEQMEKNGESEEKIADIVNSLNPNVLTIGFARRFATYKRANLIFRDIERIKRILNNPDMPIQIIFAGKAHPADRPAHEIIKHVYDISKQSGFVGKVFVVENYNMEMAKMLVQGVDVWMNNPRRPLEASGTSGQKAAANGVVNFSVLDGWWCEGYNGKNGWTIGKNEFYRDEYQQDNADSQSIYETLERIIAPMYYERNEKGIPEKWISYMKESIRSLSYRFSTYRMLKDYIREMYVPCMEKADKISESSYALTNNLAAWKEEIAKKWHQVGIDAEKTMNELKEYKAITGQSMNICANVHLGDIDPNSVKVQLYYGKANDNGLIIKPNTADMTLKGSTSPGNYLYSADICLYSGGEYNYTFRVIPYHPDMINPFEMQTIRWAVQ